MLENTNVSPVKLRNLGIPRSQTEDRKGPLRARIIGSVYHGGWKDTEGNNTNTSIHLLVQQKSQTRGLEGYESSSSALPIPQRLIPMENGEQEVQPSIKLGRT
ncbi:hypothetical protein O181_036222 [Austropuccinia psidii MF-1]|uniref:Uncharacterized protein n=1 Tax=Austropuccinia psidii MF-1 TaxID=1389203 RepID=A0A9Q3D6Q0_9BASI|nr:hypothetical protein [Austropuccinia psidii MF-1]